MSRFVAWGIRGVQTPFSTLDPGNGVIPQGKPGGPQDPAKDPDDSGGWVVGAGPEGAKVKGTVGGVDLDIHLPWGTFSDPKKDPPKAVVSKGDVKLDTQTKSGIFSALGVSGESMTPLIVVGAVLVAFFLLSRR